jgi:hypothetical protein
MGHRLFLAFTRGQGGGVSTPCRRSNHDAPYKGSGRAALAGCATSEKADPLQTNSPGAADPVPSGGPVRFGSS